MNKKKNSVYICLIFSIIILTSFSLANISYAADKSDSITLSQNDIIESSKSLYSYIKINEKLPESIKVSNKNYSTEQFLFSMSNTVICKKDNIKCYITIKSNFKKLTRV